MTITQADKSLIMSLLKIKDNRSFSKHLKELINENWVGFDVKKEVYYIRGNKELRRRYGFYKTTAVIFDIENDASDITGFVQAAIVCNEIRRRNIARKARIIKLAGRFALIKESATQDLSAKGKISEYIGLSLSVMSKLLEVSKSQADRIKTRIEKLRYLSSKPKFKTVHVAEQPDFNLIRYLPTNRRYSVKKVVKKGRVMYEFRERTYDEMFSCMEFKAQKGLVRKLRNQGGFGESVKVKGLGSK